MSKKEKKGKGIFKVIMYILLGIIVAIGLFYLFSINKIIKSNYQFVKQN